MRPTIHPSVLLPSISSASPINSSATSNRHIGISARPCPSTARSGDEVGALWALAEYTFTVAFRDGLDAATPVYQEGIAAARRRRRRRRALLDGVRRRPVHGARGTTGRSARPVRDGARRSVARRALPALGDPRVGAVSHRAGRSRPCRRTGRGVDRLRPCGGRPDDVGDGAMGPDPSARRTGKARGGRRDRCRARGCRARPGTVELGVGDARHRGIRHRGGRRPERDRSVRRGVVAPVASPS